MLWANSWIGGLFRCGRMLALSTASVFALSSLLLVPQAGYAQELEETTQATEESSAEARATQDYGLRYPEVQRAIRLFKQGKVDAARQVLADARIKHTEIPPVDVMMARLHLSANEIQKAESALERVVVEEPNDPEGFVLLGDLSLRAKRFVFAELAYTRAYDLLDQYDAIPDRKRNLQIRVLGGLASLAENRKQYDQALQHLTSWVKSDPKNPVALGSLGRVNFLAKNYDEARAAFVQLSEVAKKAPPPEIAMGRLYSDAGMHDEALQEMKLAAEKQSDDTRALLTVAEWALSNGVLDFAEQNIAASLKLDSDLLHARVLSARLARYTDDVAKAETLLAELVPLSPNSFVVTDEYARTLAASSDEKKRAAALQYAQRNFEVQRKRASTASAQAIVTYAWTLFQNNQGAKAEAAVQTLPDGSSISNENGYFVAAIYAGRGKKDVASGMLKALLGNDRPFPLRDQVEILLAKLSSE